jgi:hypothetical protein
LMKVYQRLLLFVMYVTYDNRDGRGYVYDPFIYNSTWYNIHY